jgi:4-hydroxy-tetrahydrodipicolinate synthase
MHRMCALAMQGHADGALAIDATLAGLHELLFVEGNPVPVKWAMATLGMIGPGIRLPLVELSAGFHGVLSDAMRMAGLLK